MCGGPAPPCSQSQVALATFGLGAPSCLRSPRAFAGGLWELVPALPDPRSAIPLLGSGDGS